MLKKFSVENFKGFQDKITFEIGSPSNYSFNSEIIENGCVTKGIIYGINSSGKSNLGLAIFDIITHLTEKQKLLLSYDFYLNMSGRKSFAEFEYTFLFDEHEVVYRYSKNDVNTLKSESLSIDGKEVIFFDFLTRDGFTLLEGSDTLNASIKNESPISRVKYVNNNSILIDNVQNQAFKKFMDFVDRMLLFYSLDSRGYEGFMNGSEGIAEGIRYYGRGLASDQKKLKEKVLETMHLVGLSASYYQKKCRELSGGECQRAAIGRAIIRSPRLLICDEVTSALDVSIQAQIMQLLFSLKKEMGMAMLFISHDLALVGGICDRVCVLHDGQLVEELPGGREMYEKAEHPYTRLLMKSVLDII